MLRDTRKIVQKLNRVRADLLSVADQVPPYQWQKRPTNGGWSAAEVIAHLTMVEETIVAGATRAVEKEPKPVPLWKRFHIPPVLAQWRFPRARTPLPLDAAFVGEKETMLARFAAAHQRAVSFLEQNRGRDLSRWRHPHPFFGSLDIFTWFRNIGYHEIRHTKQLRDIVQSL